MDFLVLVLVDWVMKFAATKKKLLLSATLGACWSVIAVAFPETYKLIVNICTYMLIGPLMIRICVGNNIKCVFKGTMVLMAVTIFLGGAMHFLYYNTYLGYMVETLWIRKGKLFIFTIISVVFLSYILRWMLQGKMYASTVKKLRLCLGDAYVDIQGLIDTGNGLTDPVTGKPVMVVEKKAIGNILNKIEDYTKVKYHMIPFRTVGCSHGIIEVITVDIMYIYEKEDTVKFENVLVGLSNHQLSGQNIFSALINPQLYTGIGCSKEGSNQ